MTERKLASIQKIDKIIPIEKADRVELVKILGWQTIVQKNQFKEGDLVIFFEIDSIVPERPEFEFMRARKFRVKTMKSPRLGVMSQGLAMSIYDLSYEVGGKIFPFEDFIEHNDYSIGTDVTQILGIQKYELPIEGGKNTKPKGLFPTYIVPKTDELRIQAFPDLLKEMQGLPFVARIKFDGTSFTAYSFKELSGICSRNLELNESDGDVYWKIARKYNLPTKLKEYCETIGINLAIQGEICGPIVIHGGRNPLNTRVDDLYLFSVYNIDEHRYMDDAVAHSIAADLGIKSVPIKFEGDSFNYTIEELLELAKGKYPGTENNIEGIVIRPKTYKYSPLIGGQLSFKVINNEYLLEEK